MPLRRRACGAIVGASIVLLASGASADESADAKAACAARAERGQRAKLDGHYRAARADFIACAQDTCPAAVRQACTDWLTETERSVPTIVIVVRDASGANVAPTRAWVDDEEIDVSSGRAVSIDPGPHVVRARGSSDAEASARIVAIEGRKAEVVQVAIAAIAAPASSGAPPTRTTDGERPRPTFTTGRWIGVGVGAAGILGRGASGLLALSAQSRWDDSAPFCNGNECDETGLSIRREGIDRANVATVVSIVSLAAVATGIVLWVVSSP